MIYLARREDVDGIKVSFLDKIVLCAMSYIYKSGYDIRYDMLFQKTSYGASNKDIWYDTKTTIGNNIDREQGKVVSAFEDDKALDKILVRILQVYDNDFITLVHMIKNSEPYKRDEDEVEKAVSLGRSTFPYWTKAEIIELVDSDNTSKIDNRIPVNEDQYKVMLKYLQLSIINDDLKLPFSYKEISTLYSMPRHLIESIEVNGFYLKK